MLLNSLKQKKISLVARWLDYRIKPNHQAVLDHQNVFILPSKEGYIFIVVIVAIFLGGVNYENSLVLALSFYLTALFVISIVHTFRNLSGLQVSAHKVNSSFVGGEASFSLKVGSVSARLYPVVEYQWGQSAVVRATVHPFDDIIVSLNLPVYKRGWYYPSRLRVATVYPLGLIRAWTLLDLRVRCLVYPKPLENRLYEGKGIGTWSQQSGREQGVDDFEGLVVYQPGDPLKHVHWKTLARGGELYSKTFTGSDEQHDWIQWSDFTEPDIEIRLSYMAYWVLTWTELGRSFGLRLPDGVIAPARGLKHQQDCLSALALFAL